MILFVLVRGGESMSDENQWATTVSQYLVSAQQQICDMLNAEEASTFSFIPDHWQVPGKGQGISCVLEGGTVIERGGVNYSFVRGDKLPPAASVNYPQLAGQAFEAMGISLVIHPRNPYAPTSHLNVRFFIARPPNQKPVWWFGGGFDLTPYYGFVEDCEHWHNMALAACKPFGQDVYPRFKKACDDYFYLPHRQEPRGIGGIFYDDLNAWGFEQSFAFMQSVVQHFMLAYQTILQRRKI